MNDFSTYSRQPPDPRQCSDCSSQYLSQSPSQSSYWSRQLLNSLFIIGFWSDTKITWWLRYLADEIHLHLMFDPLRKELSNLSPLSLTEIGQLFRVDDIVLMKYPILFHKILNNWPWFFYLKSTEHNCLQHLEWSLLIESFLSVHRILHSNWKIAIRLWIHGRCQLNSSFGIFIFIYFIVI